MSGVNLFVNRLFLLCAFWVATPPGLSPLLSAVENRYNKAQSLRLDFTEIYAAGRRPVQSEAGVLTLQKPGKMRWEYRTPAGKLFVSNGKEVYLYTPAENRAVRGKLKETEDMRAPLAFLLGKLSFEKEFKSVVSREDGGETWIVAEPKSANLAYIRVEFQALASGEIRQVRVTGQDQSRLSFTFANEVLNPTVNAGQFVFKVPVGVEIVTETER